MAEASTAELLRENLTEYGLVRILAREDIPPKLVHEVPLEEAARAVQRSMGAFGTPSGVIQKREKGQKSEKVKEGTFLQNA